MVLGIYGSGGLGREIMELAAMINSVCTRWSDVFFIDDSEEKKEVQKHKVVTFAKAMEQDRTGMEFIVAVGEPAVREKLFRKLHNMYVPIATLIHPDVHVPESTKIGKGSVVCSGVFVSCNVEIKENVLLQPQCNIGHDCIINGHSVISGHANLAGNCRVGMGVYIGLSACIRENIAIGNFSIVGMGTVVVKNIPEEVIVTGNPGRITRINNNKRVFK